MRGRSGLEQRVVDSGERDDRGGEWPRARRPHEGLEARRRAQAFDAHGADLDDRIAAAIEPGRLDVDDREARA